MKPLNYSIPQRVLHWGMALLIFFNLIFTEGMETWNRAAEKNETITPDMISSANIHAYVGIAILVLALLRIVLRLVQGAPDLPADEPPVLRMVAAATHGLLYLLMIILPLSGMAKYYFGQDFAGELHAEVFKTVLWLFIILHVAGALAQKFYFKTDVLDRMTKGVKG
jgi:cytochrome b561